MKKPLVNQSNVKRGGWSKTPDFPIFGCFFIWSIECLGETDFAQLITSLSNDN